MGVPLLVPSIFLGVVVVDDRCRSITLWLEEPPKEDERDKNDNISFL